MNLRDYLFKKEMIRKKKGIRLGNFPIKTNPKTSFNNTSSFPMVNNYNNNNSYFDKTNISNRGNYIYQTISPRNTLSSELLNQTEMERNSSKKKRFLLSNENYKNRTLNSKIYRNEPFFYGRQNLNKAFFSDFAENQDSTNIIKRRSPISLNNKNIHSTKINSKKNLNYLHVKLNFNLLQQKLEKLNNIITPIRTSALNNKTNTIDIGQNYYKRKSFLKNKINLTKSSILNDNKINSHIDFKKQNNLNEKKNIYFNLRPNKFKKYNNSINIIKNFNSFKTDYIGNNYLTSGKIKEDTFLETENELSQIADHIINVIGTDHKKPKKNIIQHNIEYNINYKTNDNNVKRYFSVSNLPEISYTPENKRTKTKSDDLIMEHVLTYNNKKNKNNEIKIQNENNNFIDKIKQIKIDSNPKKVKITKEENIIKPFENSDDEEEDGDKVIQTLLEQVSKKVQNDQNNKKTNITVGKIDKMMKKKNIQKKKINFDDNIIYINYKDENKITELNITNNKNKILKFQSKDINKYWKLLKSNQLKIKPALINTDKVDYQNIISKIKVEDSNKSNTIKDSKKIIRKNIDIIRLIKNKNKKTINIK